MTGRRVRERVCWGLVIGASALLLVGSNARSASAQPFEGEIQMRLSSTKPGDPARFMEYATRRGALRLTATDAPGGLVMLLPRGDSKLYVLLPAQQSYMEAPMPPTTAPDGNAALTVKKTGRKETIAGVACEHLAVTYAGGTVDLCLTTALGPWLNPLRAAARSASGSVPFWDQALGADGFPLKVILPDGTVSMEVIKVERKRVAPSLFEVPPSYVKMDVPARR